MEAIIPAREHQEAVIIDEEDRPLDVAYYAPEIMS